MARLLLFGILAGTTWAAAFRAYMVELAGAESRVDWLGTFLLVLVPGAAVGALLGVAEHMRRTGGRTGWRWLAAAPLLLAVAALLPPGAFIRLVTTGIGGGAIGVVAVGMLGGYAVSGRGPLWARVVCGALALLLGGATVASGALINPGLSAASARGAWVLVLVAGLLALLVLACAIPHRRVVPAEVDA